MGFCSGFFLLKKKQERMGEIFFRPVKQKYCGAELRHHCGLSGKSCIFAAPYEGEKAGSLMRNLSYQQVEKLLTAFFFSVDNSILVWQSVK